MSHRFYYMNKLLLLPILVLCALMGMLYSSCIDDDITTSPSATLTFSRDTVTFDTIFTGQGTPTARLLVYNRSKKGVNISSIQFENSTSVFSMNVDGQSGDSFHDIEIRGKDSIYIFIECLIDTNTVNEPFLTSDRLVFITNGVRQTVEVEAYGQNVTRLKALTLTSNTHLTSARPYVVFDSLVVAPGVTLTIDPGARIMFHDKASMIVHGRIVAEGTPEAKIHLRGDRLDKVLPDLPYDGMSSQWGGVRITAGSYDNSMKNVDMRSTDYGLMIDSCGNLDRRKLLIVNSWLHNSAGNVLTSFHAWIDAYGVCFSEAAHSVVLLTGGRHEMSQCTFANNYLFGIPTGVILALDGLKQSETYSAPTMKATFNNSIISGLGSPISPGDLADTDVYLNYVLFGVTGDNDEHFLNCLWDKDPLFLTVRTDYYFNYHVRLDSPAVSAGNPMYVTPMCLYDMDDIDRLSLGAPTLGAYAGLAPAETE